jgi:probable HAF family extracellular repeat protein
MFKLATSHSLFAKYIFTFCCLAAIASGSIAQTASLEIKSNVPIEVYDEFQFFGSVDGGYHPVSADGLTIIGSLDQGTDQAAYRWSATTGLQMLGDLPGGRIDSSAAATIADGSVVIGRSWGTGFASLFFRWDELNGMTLADAVPAGFYGVMPSGVSDTSLFVIGNLDTGGSGIEPFIWDEANGYNLPGRLATGSTWATDVSDDGGVVVGYGYNANGDTEAYRWTQQSGFTLLGDLPGHYYMSRALAVSGDGATVVGWSAMREACDGLCNIAVLNRAFRWTLSGGMEDLGFTLGSINNFAYSVSRDGSVVLIDTGSDFAIWREGVGIEKFNDYVANEAMFDVTDWTLIPLRVIEIDGQPVVAGIGRHAQDAPVLWHLVMDASQLPTITINSPSAGSSFGYQDTINFTGMATDPVDGDVSSSMVWDSSIDGVLGVGASISAQLTVGTHIIAAEVTSTGGTRRSSGITINVTNASPAVSIAAPTSTSFNTGDIIALSATASDAEDGDLTPSISWSSPIAGDLGQGGNVSTSLAEGSHTITAMATDSMGASDTDSVQILVINEAPVAVNDAANLDEAASVSIDLAANDSDAYEGIDPSSIVIVTQPAQGSLAVNSEGAVIYTHNGSESVSDSFGYTIQDFAGKTSNLATVNISINPINDVPIANGDAFELAVGETQTFSIVANDIDADNGLDLQSIQITNDVSFGNLELNADGTVTYTHTGSESQVDSFSYSIADNSGLRSAPAEVLLTIDVATTPLSYCSSRGNYSLYEWVAAIGLAGENHASGGNGGYLDATETIFNVQSGSSVPLELTPGYASSAYKEYWAVWIDFNQDGVFESGERVYSGSGNSTLSGNIAIPVTALEGQTRMRIAMKYGSTPQPCDTFTYGEVEDYTVNIQPGLPYQLSSTSDHVVARTGTAADNVSWVVEEDGVIVFSGVVAGSLSYQYPDHQVGSQYRIWLRDPVDLEVVSNVVVYTFEDNQIPPPLCASGGNNANYEWIDSVTFGGYVNASGRNGGYLDMTAAAAVEANSHTIPTTLQPGGYYTEYWAIWIDINRDGQLTSEERLYTHSGSYGTSTTLNVPSTVTSGDYRMRISMKYGGTPPACGNFTYGEVEDYLIRFNL